MGAVVVCVSVGSFTPSPAALSQGIKDNTDTASRFAPVLAAMMVSGVEAPTEQGASESGLLLDDLVIEAEKAAFAAFAARAVSGDAAPTAAFRSRSRLLATAADAASSLCAGSQSGG